MGSVRIDRRQKYLGSIITEQDWVTNETKGRMNRGDSQAVGLRLFMEYKCSRGGAYEAVTLEWHPP